MQRKLQCTEGLTASKGAPRACLDHVGVESDETRRKGTNACRCGEEWRAQRLVGSLDVSVVYIVGAGMRESSWAKKSMFACSWGGWRLRSRSGGSSGVVGVVLVLHGNLVLRCYFCLHRTRSSCRPQVVPYRTAPVPYGAWCWNWMGVRDAGRTPTRWPTGSPEFVAAGPKRESVGRHAVVIVVRIVCGRR